MVTGFRAWCNEQNEYLKSSLNQKINIIEVTPPRYLESHQWAIPIIEGCFKYNKDDRFDIN
jgi:hypothetical protein